jgi:hypothetical protein
MQVSWLFLRDSTVRRKQLLELDLLALLLAALCHDLEHPGTTNAYQVNTGSALALRYNDNHDELGRFSTSDGGAVSVTGGVGNGTTHVGGAVTVVGGAGATGALSCSLPAGATAAFAAAVGSFARQGGTNEAVVFSSSGSATITANSVTIAIGPDFGVFVVVPIN